MNARLLLAWASVGLIGIAQAGPAAEVFANCPAGPPQQDLLQHPIADRFWRDGPVLAVFWSVDCAFCQRHNERLNRLLQTQPGAAVLGIAVDDRPDAVRRTAARRGYGFPVIGDDCGLRVQLTPRQLVPMTCWLGDVPKGPRCIPGEMTDDDLRELLNQARSSRHS